MSDAPKTGLVISPAVSNDPGAASLTPFTDALGDAREGLEVLVTQHDGRTGVQVVAAKELGRGWSVAGTVQKEAGRPVNAAVGARWRPGKK
jgi:hypothetical protein